MIPRDLALARKRSYDLLGRLFLVGIGEDDLSVLQSLPELAPHLPDPFKSDEVAAAHQSLFGFNLLPFQSVFLTAERVLGGAVTDQLQRQALALGYDRAASGTLDHIGEQLLLLAHLCGGEALWLAKGEAREAALLAADQAAWLEGQLLRWLFPFVGCLRRQGEPFYTAVGELTLNLLVDQWTAEVKTVTVWSLPVVPDVLGDETSGLKEMAAYFMTPVYSGLFLTKDDLTAIGRQFRLPRGFGSRDQMMTNLLRSAAQYDDVATLMAALGDLVSGELAQYERWSADWPAMRPFLQPWMTRLQATQLLIGSVSEQVQRLAAESD